MFCVNYKFIWGCLFITFVCVVSELYKINDYKDKFYEDRMVLCQVVLVEPKTNDK